MSDPIRRGFTSASNAESDKLCPGRHLAQRGIPEPPKSEDASSGTKIHQALADSGNVKFMDSLTLAERETFDACRDIEKKLVAQLFDPADGPIRPFRHRRFWVKITTNTGQTLEHSGEADVVWRQATRILILDFKTLAGDTPESPRNMQLRDLSVLARGELTPVTEVGTAIVQPFVTHTPELCVYTEPDLLRAEQEMFVRVAGSNHPESERVAGKHQCAFCLAKSKCVEYQTWAAAFTPSKLQDLVYVAMANWTPEQAAAAAEALAPAYDFLDQVKEWLKQHVPPGWTLAPGAKRELITNPQECFNRFAALGGSLDQFMTTISVGKTKLREAVNQVTGAKGMALDKAIDDLIAGIIETKQNAPSLRKEGK